MSNRGIRRVVGALHIRLQKRLVVCVVAAAIAIASSGVATTSQSAEGVVAASALSSQTVSDDVDTAIRYTGSWRISTVGGTLHTLVGAGSARLAFSGTDVSWIGPRGPAGGIADVHIDGVRVATVDTYAASSSIGILFQTTAMTDAPHTIEVRGAGRRSSASSSTEVTIDRLESGTAAGQPAFGRYGRPFDVDPTGSAASSILATPSTTERAELQAIATRPVATWFGDWNNDITSAVRQRIAGADARGAVATLVMYDIPNRDCGAYSATRVHTAEQYREWARAFVAGLGTSRAIVIVEPDALLLTDCLDAAQESERYELIGYAVGLLQTQGSWAYIDAGHNQWRGAAEIARRLQLAGVDRAAGFSLNVSNFKATNLLIDFATDVSARTGGSHFVIDTSRNGRPLSTGEWCNPAGMGLGTPPTTATASRLADAYLWIKAPGESDGPCNGGPAAGGWFPSYALTLVRNAAG